ncbi:MAG: GGDEF domain-containing protein [Treponema sp.]|jgi:diguanylate cyclase (GGDEF)-like protein|nr:GGDEF domain-containing protein [Treponema sp.]
MDLFEHEQKIFDRAAQHLEDIRAGKPAGIEEFAFLVNEYGRLLKWIRRNTHFSDRTSSELLETNIELEDKLHVDVLTGIYNRRFMEENLKRVIRSLSRAKGTLSVMMVDVDFFKRYNDTYGHSMGDDCLKAIAIAITKAVERADDFVARYGGEEFVVVLPYTEEAGAEVTAVKLLEGVRALRIPHEQSDAADHVTISIGVTTVKVVHGHDYMDYIKRADEALYVSKQTGRNKYTYLKYDKKGGCGNET